jgi:hypothetical protein
VSHSFCNALPDERKKETFDDEHLLFDDSWLFSYLSMPHFSFRLNNIKKEVNVT